MSYSLFANHECVPEQRLSVDHLPEGYNTRACMPELGRLSTLRNALLLLKVPLANSCGLHNLVESQLLSNDVYDRVLGKLTADKADKPSTWT